jgi:DNA invertase Pin-like site-specific DNA recombinase
MEDLKMIYNVGAYLRLSRDDERDGESLSIENQRSIVADFITKKGWSLIDTYVDDGLTGTNFDRPNFQRMIDDVRNGRINCVVVKDLSRFGRNYIQIGQYTDYLFPTMGCRFIAINDGIDTLEKENELMPFKNLVNEWYSRDQSKKVKSAKVARAKSGFFMGAYAPYGYVKNEDKKPPLLIDEYAAPIVRRIFEMRASGMGYRTIATRLNDEGIIPPREYYYNSIGKPNPKRGLKAWSDVVVREILRNEAYIGNIVQMRKGTISYKNKTQVNRPEEEWVRAVGTHEPIISMELWETACKLGNRGTVGKSNKDGKISLFSGLLKCNDCGRSMKFVRDSNTRKDGHKNNHHAYICCGYSQGGKAVCSPHRTLESIFSGLILGDIREKARLIAIDEDAVIAEIKRKKQADTTSEQKALEKNLQTLRHRLSELEHLISKLYEEMVLGDIPREMVLGMMEKYKKEQQEKSILAAQLAEQLTHSQEVEHDIREWVSLIRKYMGVEELDRELLIKLVDKIVVGQKKVVDGVEMQEITIIYNLVGQID